MQTEKATRRLAAMFLFGGSMHFLASGWFDKIIPAGLPGRTRTYTYLSGATALAIGAGLAIPKTRRPAAAAATAFLIGVMPAKIKLTRDWLRSDKPGWAKAVGVVQLFWQAPLIADAIKAGADPRRRSAPRS
ncbi:membrane protein [Microlunatus parietis]